MLEPADAQGRARGIIGHFEDLTKAHELVTRARDQLEALRPLVATSRRYDAALAERDALEAQRSAVRLYVAELRARLLAEGIARCEADGERLWQEKDAAETVSVTLAAEREALIEERARAGGDRIGELERLSVAARGLAADRRRRRTAFDVAVADAGLEQVVDAAGFAALAATVAAAQPVIEVEQRRVDARFADLVGTVKEFERRAQATLAELSSLEQRTSNLPASHMDLRERLRADLGLSSDDLPYAGELLDLVDDRGEWRGAAERVLRGFALSMLVRQEHYDAVAGWVNSRRLTARGRDGHRVGTKLVYERVAVRRVPLQRHAIDGLVLADCLMTKDSPFREYLLEELTRRADFRCVDSLAEFRAERRAVTREGQVRSGERHEKDDRSRVDDPRTWVLGWANEHKIAALRAELAESEAARDAAEAELQAVEETRTALRKRQEAHSRLAGFDSWTDLDHDEADARAREHDAERQRLEAGSLWLAEIQSALERNAARRQEVSGIVEELTIRLATLAADAERFRVEKARDEELVAMQSPEVLMSAR
jgi:uncharacterized protein YPO0396